ncbi:MAG: chorismate synthase [Eubacteriales bacterium]|nr:chorismate synthase [Eubacteriales bacterium]
MSSEYGKNIRVSIFGQSHSEGIGVVIDGIPAGERFDMKRVHAFMRRRSAVGKDYSTMRKEADEPHILSGLLEDGDSYVSCGAPVCAVIYNADTRSKDYSNLKDVPRPSHADYPAAVKYRGFHDIRGGGHFSGRLTAPLCFAGALCIQMLEKRGIHVGAHIAAIHGVLDHPYDAVNLTAEEVHAAGEKAFPVNDDLSGERMLSEIGAAKAAVDSVGGIVECGVTGLPCGLGEPMFEGAENKIAQIVFGIPAVKGIEFGAGFEMAARFGSENNDPFEMKNGRVSSKTNHAGGILGGITTGMPLIFRAAFKPTASIARAQQSVSLSRKEDETLVIHGRHDPCIVPRAVPCVEAAAAIAVYDLLRDALSEGFLSDEQQQTETAQ